MRTGVGVAADRLNARRRDLDEVLRHAAAEEDRRGARARRHEAVHDGERDLVVLEEIHDRAALSRHPVRLGQRAIRRRRDEERHAVAEAGGGDRAAEPLGVQPSTELVHEPDARDGRPGPRRGQVLEEPGQEILHVVVRLGADDVVVEAIEPALPEVLVVHVIGIDLVERHAALLQHVLGGVGRGRHDDVYVAPLHQPGDEWVHPRARHGSGQADGDEAVTVDHPLPDIEGLPEPAPLEGRPAHPFEEPVHPIRPEPHGDPHVQPPDRRLAPGAGNPAGAGLSEWAGLDSNQGPTDYESAALTD